MKKEYYISDLKSSVGLTASSTFALRSKETRNTRANKPYLYLVLQDKTGTISGKVWSDSIARAENVEAGDIVIADFEVQEYNGNIDLTIRSLVKTDDYISEELVVSNEKIDFPALEQELKKRIDSVRDMNYRQILDAFFDDPAFYEKYTTVPAGDRVHHDYRHGLLHHTLEVLKIADSMAHLYPDIDHDLLVTGALLHDIGKTEEYVVSETGTISWSDEGTFFRHIVLGQNMIIERLPKDFPELMKNKLLHIILSHQGKLEFGSPVLPTTKEAMCVYFADMSSTYLNIGQKAIDDAKEKGTEENFGGYNKYLGTAMYLGD